MDDDIQEINTDPSWSNVLLTICVASAAIYFFFSSSHQQSSSLTSASSTLNQDERQKRRERLAAIAEERRIAMDDNIQGKATTTDTSVNTLSKSINYDQHTKQKSETNGESDKVKSKQKEKREEINTKKVDNSNNEKSQQVSVDEIEQVAANNSLVVSSSKSIANEEEEMKADTANNTKLEEGEKEIEDKKSSNNSTENNEEDESAEAGVKEESRQRTQKAIAKLKASKKEGTKKKVIEEEEEDSSSIPKLLTVYLILTSCPGSSRLELTIPNNISTAILLQQVSQTSRIAITDMKLIFRGRIINNTTKTVRGKKEKNAVDEYGIVEGCALHVMGKPTLPEVQDAAADSGIVETDPEEVDDEAAGVEQPNTYEDYEWDELPSHVQAAATTLGYSPQLWDSDGEPFSEELYWEELTGDQRRAATILGYNEQTWNDDSSQDDEEMLLLIDRIRRSTGEALYHRQAREGDLAGLQEAVNAGFSNILSVPDANGWTTLHEAIRAGNTEIIEYLVRDVGLDLTDETNQERNALSLAQDFHGEEGAVTLLIESLLQESEESTTPPTEE